MILYKYNQGIKKIIKYNRIGDQLFFNDTVQAGDSYCLINESKIGSPFYFYTKNFTDISSSAIQADYILITHPILVSKANEYSAFINQNYGLTTKVINVFDIYDQFNYGFFAPEPIRDFLMAANNNWQSPKPTYLFLVGDANYDYYGNKALYLGTPKVMNFVPSFGQPVSDTWFTIWNDTTGALIPQMYLGRVPASSLEEFQHFFDKHKAYLSTPYDDWNKYYLLFSSGDGTDPNQLNYLKQTNDSVIYNFIQPSPIAGIAQHLYKTFSPLTDFGPYTQDQINSMIGMGGVFISYIGHSGTQIWDNGISDVNQLKNNRGRSSMISDFGCSTGEFAEPDIKAFSELFVTGLDGDAIGYEGNSSLGFASTATTFPLLFYKKILKDNVFELGKAHVMAKIDMLKNIGSGGIYGVFAYSNTLFSDPVIKLKVPPKPNLTISPKNISLDKDFLDESIDSATVKIIYNNYGMVLPQNFTVWITHSINGLLKDTLTFRRLLPMMSDSIIFKIPVKGFVGSHQLDIVLDKNSEIDEIYKNDNSTSYTFNVASNAIRILTTEPINNIGNGTFIYINPVNKSVSDSIQFESANNQGFSPSQIYYKKLDTAYTKISIPGLVQGSRYWLRSKMNASLEYGSTISFIYDSTSGFSYYLGDSVSFSSLHLNGIRYDGVKLLLDKTYKDLVVKSAGYYDGGFAYIGINGNNLLTAGNLDGIQVVVFSDSNLTFESTERFNYWDNPALFDSSFIHFLDTVSAQKTVCFAFCGGAGYGTTDSMKTLLHQFGSKYIDSVDFRYSWALIGKKGSIPGTVPEKWSKPNEGFVTLDSSYAYDIKNGRLTTEQFGPVKKWNKFKANYTAVNSSSISFVPIGIKQDGTSDTLSALNIINGEADLSFINSSIYGNIQIIVSFSKGLNSIPSINNLKLEYDNFPEIGTNYQAVKLLKDTVTIGENLNLSFKVLNEGFTRTDSIKVRLERVKPDNSRETISESIIDNLLPGTSKSYNIVYPTLGGAGSGSFAINIDPDNKIREFYKDNNLYAVPFYVKGDTTHSILRVNIGDSDILDGDYISSTPKIRTELDDFTLLPFTDSTSIIMTLNDSLISNLNNPFVKVYFNNANPKMVVEYTPKLANGEYILNVKGRNTFGILIDSAGITRRFHVSNELKLLDVYNYPNPFSKNTYFTFKLTQIPDDLNIRIFSVAGRLVKVIYKKSYELNYDFNRIYWDGRDADGDLLANGVYFYKMILKKGNMTQDVTQKLAIIK
jgi:CARDB.